MTLKTPSKYMLENLKLREARQLLRNTLQRYFEAIRVSFQINADPLLPPGASPYPRRIIAYKNGYWSAVFQNLRKARRRWGVVSKVLTKMGATVWAREKMYKSVAQTVILYGR